MFFDALTFVVSIFFRIKNDVNWATPVNEANGMTKQDRDKLLTHGVRDSSLPGRLQLLLSM